jgi:hypothetical protein
MRKYGPSVLLLAALAIVLTLACGSSPRMLRSVSLSPPPQMPRATQSSSWPRVTSANNLRL